jgi:hypothetical protein
LSSIKFRTTTLIFALLLMACEPATQKSVGKDQVAAAGNAVPEPIVVNSAPERQALFGDLHVHTMYSFDAFIFGTTASPDQAYQFAKGGAMRHPGGFDMKLRQPLDFYAVTDHGIYLGAMRAMALPGSELGDHPLAETVRNVDDEQSRIAAFRSVVTNLLRGSADPSSYENVARQAWTDIVAAANRHYEPGKFTTLVGYEFTARGNASANLHRNVFFRGGQAPELPFSAADSRDPEDLWAWMDKQRSVGLDALAIPHNSNGSNGEMFSGVSFTGAPLTKEYADARGRNEPLIEIVQIKGQSDTHPLLSPNDEYADFEIMPYQIGSRLKSQPQGSFAREALGNGLVMQAQDGFNPFRFGFIGSSDTHNASYAGYEDEFWGKSGIREDEPHERGSIPNATKQNGDPVYGDDYYTRFGAAGLAGVWAEENTRDSIFEALRRKETFATSGPRMKVRFFAGLDMPDLDDPNMLAQAYANGVPMGGELLVDEDAVPEFLIWAQAEADGVSLARVQVIKSYVANGKRQERIFDAACSDGAAVDPDTHRCADNGAQVNLTDCSVSQNVGDLELRTLWQDPEHRSGENAVYYLRVLQNPTCRWSTWDAVRAGIKPREDLDAVIAERAWSSPIWLSS